MRARIPAGIDLEDRLLYGLSPARLGYVSGLLVAAIWFWRQAMPVPIRLLPVAMLLSGAAAVGWMRYEGRHLDSWAEDLVRHVAARYRLEFDLGILRRPRLSIAAGMDPAAEAGAERTRPVQAPAPSEVAVLVIASVEPP